MYSFFNFRNSAHPHVLEHLFCNGREDFMPTIEILCPIHQAPGLSKDSARGFVSLTQPITDQLVVSFHEITVSEVIDVKINVTARCVCLWDNGESSSW